MDDPLDAPLHDVACDRHPPDDVALVFAWANGTTERFTFRDMARASKDVAAQLAEAGVAGPARVAVILPQTPLAPVVHLAASRLGAVVVPLSPLFGPDGLAPRLAASGCVLAITHAEGADAVREAAPGLALWSTDGRVPTGAARDFTPPALPRLISFGRERLRERPLSLIFTSGTSASPKAALLPHRVVAGRMPGFRAVHPGIGRGDVFWSPSDWSWIGGLYDALFAPWCAGAAVFAYERTGRFDAATARARAVAGGVTRAFLAPTALRSWQSAGVAGVPLTSLHTAGEPLGADLAAWAQSAFGTPVRDVYGLTESAFLLINPGGDASVTGVPPPEREVRVLTPTLAPAEPGVRGELCVKEGATTMMLGYVVDDCVRLPLDSAGWFHTGDVAVADEAGRITVLGRLDDVVNTSGYRVAPREVEAAVAAHPAVADCVVVGVPDAARGTVLKAFIVKASDVTESDIVAFVHKRLAAHQVPRAVAFVDALPRTPSGKVLRRVLRDA